MNKNKLRNTLVLTVFLLVAGMFLTVCDGVMGLGDPVDLEAPELWVLRIELADGTVKTVQEEGNKMFIGPGILFGDGAFLVGEALDNKNVETIHIEEIGDNAVPVNGSAPSWTTVPSQTKNSNGRQEWRINLDGIQSGERLISITALDRPGNIGPDTVQQLTLLVDVNPPVVESILVDRGEGVQVSLLPRAVLGSFDHDVFENIHFFQNEKFSINAKISHDFSLSGVRMNLVDVDGTKVFAQDLDFPSSAGSLYVPSWTITHDMIVQDNELYARDKHIFNVVITATATAGHSGMNEDITNTLFCISWFPESDLARIQTHTQDPVTKNILVEKGAVIPITVFDDDKVDSIYTGLVTLEHWENMPGETDIEKLENINHASFADELGQYILETSQINAPVTRTVVSLDVNKMRGQYRLITLVRDRKENGFPASWSRAVRNVVIMEDGVPIIMVEDPPENTDPPLTDNRKFAIKGRIVNLDPVNITRIAWVPVGYGSGETQITAVQEMLKGNAAQDGVKIWSLENIPSQTILIPEDNGKPFSRQNFEFEFDIFDDFIVNGVPENEIKVFILYTQSRAEKPEDLVDVFYTLRLLPYKQPPVIEVLSPTNLAVFDINEQINFILHPYSERGLAITEVRLISRPSGNELNLEPGTLVRNGTTLNVWRATDSHQVLGDFQYEIRVRDSLGNSDVTDLFVRIDTLPVLTRIDTPHNQGSVFSGRDEIRVQAIFDRPVEAVNTAAGVPRIRLTNFSHGANRYAYYQSGAGTNTLVFLYTIISGDHTGSNENTIGFLQADAIELNGGTISAAIPPGALNTTITNPLFNKQLSVQGIPPRIVGVAVAKQAGKSNYQTSPTATADYAWHREGEVFSIDVTLSKEARVLGNPSLLLPITNAQGVVQNRYASFQTTSNSNRTMRFTYKVADGDLYDPVNLTIDITNCFSNEDRDKITDTVGGRGNFLTLGGTQTVTRSSDVRVDAVRPAAVPVIRVGLIASDGPQTRRYEVRSNLHDAGGNPVVPAVNVIETHYGTRVQFTVDGVTWTDINDPLPKEIVANQPTTYNIGARQIDRAGNEGIITWIPAFSLLSDSALVSIVCDNPNGIYSEGSVLNFKLIFNGPVSSAGTGTVTLWGGNATGNTGNITINLPVITAANADFAIPFSWTVGANRRMMKDNPAGRTLGVEIDAVNLAGVKRESGTETLFSNDNSATLNTMITTVRDAYNAARTGVEVLSIRPTITGGAPVSNSVISVTGTGDAARSTITLVFDAAVWPERGYIRVRPTATAGGNTGVTTGNWLIPPVLTNEEFTTVSNGLSSSADRNALQAAGRYVRTTHGIKPNAGNTAYVPDTDTKYVLNFETGIDNATAGSNTTVLRNLMNSAKYMWQEIEVVNTDRVSGAGTNTITVNLDPLPAGRQWKVEIDANSFRDVASNYFAGWQEAEGAAATNQRWFWSNVVSTPVIRVDRVSNNRAYAGATGTFQTNVRYRIDTVTPGAAIQRGEYNRSSTVPSNTSTDIDVLRGLNGGIARITSGAMPGQGDSDPYRANANPGHAGNSNIPDATVAAIETNSGTNLVINTSYTMGNYINLGGRVLEQATSDADAFREAMYTARKDYIGATATRAGLTASARGYEGAFKTVIVYRGVQDQVGTNRFLKIEATNTRNGAVTIAGFPMRYNDMSGTWNRFFYRNGTANSSDWIFISWEIVSEFWQVSPLTRNDAGYTMGALWNNNDNDNSWQPFSANYQVHNYRVYGNWGMQRGNR
ncbi:MAG: hypothetical protein FWC01_00505 [Treponema sp.]|nr:hypothetical protein [Treponema sp.]MCL2236649.1 hypothetical protein [Treponema sp.]